MKPLFFLLLGYLWGDGRQDPEGAWHFRSHRIEVVDRFIETARAHGGQVIRTVDRGMPAAIVTGLKFSHLDEAHMPKELAQATDAEIREFVAAVIEGEGALDGLVFDDKHEEPVRGMVELFTRLGIRTRVEKQADGYLNVYALRESWDTLQRLPYASHFRVPEGEFAIALLPDTQRYAEFNPAIFYKQMEWLAANAKREQIQCVIHLGDITERNTAAEWEMADRGYRLLDQAKVPYTVLPGNHDGLSELKRDTTMFNRYFGPARFLEKPWYGGHRGAKNDANYALFEAAGLKFLVVNLPFGPLDADLEWAAGILQRYPDRRAILATHAYMYNDDTRLGEGDLYNPHLKAKEWNDGEEIWEKLARKHPNLFLVVSGHVYGTGRMTSRNDAGQPVHQLLADYQKFPEGGEGWPRILRFVPVLDEIRVETYSPWLGGFSNREEDRFVLRYRMKGDRMKGASR